MYVRSMSTPFRSDRSFTPVTRLRDHTSIGHFLPSSGQERVVSLANGGPISGNPCYDSPGWTRDSPLPAGPYRLRYPTDHVSHETGHCDLRSSLSIAPGTEHLPKRTRDAAIAGEFAELADLLNSNANELDEFRSFLDSNGYVKFTYHKSKQSISSV